MGIGIGIVLIVVGLILVLNVFSGQLDNVIGLHGQHTLGWIFLAVGVLAVILVLIMNAQRQRTTRIERREDPRV